MPIILTTLRSVLSQGVEIQLKILQTLVSLLTNCKDVHNELLAEVCLILQLDGKGLTRPRLLPDPAHFIQAARVQDWRGIVHGGGNSTTAYHVRL